MSTTIIASLLVGAVLALRFKVFILVPTILSAWAVLTGIGLVWEITQQLGSRLEIAVVTTALQVGVSQSPAAGGELESAGERSGKTASGRPLRAPTWQGQAPAEDSHTIAAPCAGATARSLREKTLDLRGPPHMRLCLLINSARHHVSDRQ